MVISLILYKYSFLYWNLYSLSYNRSLDRVTICCTGCFPAHSFPLSWPGGCERYCFLHRFAPLSSPWWWDQQRSSSALNSQGVSANETEPMVKWHYWKPADSKTLLLNFLAISPVVPRNISSVLYPLTQLSFFIWDL